MIRVVIVTCAAEGKAPLHAGGPRPPQLQPAGARRLRGDNYIFHHIMSYHLLL